MSTILNVDGVVKRFDGHTAVDQVSFTVEAGKVYGLLGPNGAGKTTTIRMIMDIIAPDEGSVRIFGEPRTDLSNHRIGYLPEERGLYRKMTVREQLSFLAEIKGMHRADIAPRVDAWLERMELVDWGPKKVEELSKGMQQKVQFIGTVIHDPELLILDEPFSGLDPINVNLIKEFMIEARERGTAIVFSTHVLEQAEKLCDDICLINRGRKILDGPLGELRERFRRPAFLVKASDGATLARLPGVKGIQVKGDVTRVELTDDNARETFLLAALNATTIIEFRPEEPDLEFIFLKAVRDASA